MIWKLKMCKRCACARAHSLRAMQFVCMHWIPHTWIVNSPIIIRDFSSVSIESKKWFSYSVAFIHSILSSFVRSFVWFLLLLFLFNGKASGAKRVSPSCINGVYFLWLYDDNDDDDDENSNKNQKKTEKRQEQWNS